MHWKEQIKKLVQPAEGRVSPAFKPHHVAVAIVMIGRRQPLGRYELCDTMSIGEGSARTLLRRLGERDYITAEGRQGQKLTHTGQEIFEAMINDIPRGLYLDVEGLAMYEISYGNLVKQKAEEVTDGIRQRDEAIIQGGYGEAGATTLVCKEGLLLMPPNNFNPLLKYEDETLLIMDSLRPKDGDVVVIGSANNSGLAREIAMASSMTLLGEE
ncbi:MAG: DUF4443 domain-containing protein [Candidatus Thorarchaeota archaeon]